MGVALETVIEYRKPGDVWQVWKEVDEEARRDAPDLYDAPGDPDFDPVFIPRGMNLYIMLGMFGDDIELEDGEPEPIKRKGEPVDMSKELSNWIYVNADGDARDRMGWVTLAELEELSNRWDEHLRAENINPDLNDGVTLRGRLVEAKKCAEAEAGREVRMVYWFWS